MTPQSTEKRRPELDGLRGLAILLVLYHHYIGLAVKVTPGSTPAYMLAPGRLAWSGVDLFFVLSGFLIGGILMDNRESPVYFKTFYLRRALRIVPLYALALTIFYLLRTSGWLYDHPAPWYAYATLTQNLWMAGANTFGANFLAATWSLAIEEQFYFTLPLMVRFVSPRRLPYVLGACVLMAPILRTLIYLTHPDPAIPVYMLLPCRMDALMLGALGAWAMRHDRLPSLRFLYASFVMLGVIVLLYSIKSPDIRGPATITVGYSVFALFYLSVLLIAVRGGFRLFRWRAMTEAGLLAYGLYLLHLPVVGWLYGHEPVIYSWKDAGFSLLALSLTFGLAKLSWELFEKPLVGLAHRFRYFPRKAASNHPATVPAPSRN